MKCLIICIIIFLLLTRSKRKGIQYIGIILFVFFISSIFIISNKLINPQTKIHQIYVEQKSNNRFLFSSIAQENFIKRPIWGFGMNNYTYLFQSNFSPKFFSDTEELAFTDVRPSTF